MQFYRQRIIGSYIVDFYCPKAKLVIEIDGSQHGEKETAEYDTIRTEYLNSLLPHFAPLFYNCLFYNYKNAARGISPPAA